MTSPVANTLVALLTNRRPFPNSYSRSCVPNESVLISGSWNSRVKITPAPIKPSLRFAKVAEIGSRFWNIEDFDAPRNVPSVCSTIRSKTNIFRLEYNEKRFFLLRSTMIHLARNFESIRFRNRCRNRRELNSFLRIAHEFKMHARKMHFKLGMSTFNSNFKIQFNLPCNKFNSSFEVQLQRIVSSLTRNTFNLNFKVRLKLRRKKFDWNFEVRVKLRRKKFAWNLGNSTNEFRYFPSKRIVSFRAILTNATARARRWRIPSNRGKKKKKKKVA